MPPSRGRRNSVRAIDTNIVIRFLTADDAQQAEAAQRLFAEGDIFIATTVFLESEWVLRSGYGFSPARIAQGLRGLAGLPGISVGDPAAIAAALDALEQGMDFADALHLQLSASCTAFLTFDRRLIRAAAGQSAMQVCQP